MKKLAWLVLALWLVGMAGGCAPRNSQKAYLDTRILAEPLKVESQQLVDSEKSIGTVAIMAVAAKVLDYGIDKIKGKAKEQEVTRVVSSNALASGKYKVIVVNGMFLNSSVKEGDNDTAADIFLKKMKESNVIFRFEVDTMNDNGFIKITPKKLNYTNSMTDGWLGKRYLTVKITVTASQHNQENEDSTKSAVVILSFDEISKGVEFGEDWFGDSAYIIQPHTTKSKKIYSSS